MNEMSIITEKKILQNLDISVTVKQFKYFYNYLLLSKGIKEMIGILIIKFIKYLG